MSKASVRLELFGESEMLEQLSEASVAVYVVGDDEISVFKKFGVIFGQNPQPFLDGLPVKGHVVDDHAEGVLAVFSEKLETNLRTRLFVYDLNQKLFDVFPAVVALFEFEYIVHGKSVDFFPHGFGEPHHEFAL